MERTNTRRRAAVTLVMLISIILASSSVTTEARQAAGGQESDGARIGEVELRVETPGSVTTRSLSSTYRPLLEAWQRDLEQIVGGIPEEPLIVRFVAEPAPVADGELTPVTEIALIDRDATVALVDLDLFLSLSDTEAENMFRRLIAWRWLVSASDGNMPVSLVDGFARYLETPVLAQQARQASLAQQAYLDGNLPIWSEILTDQRSNGATEPAIEAASRMALAAFLVERYGASVIAELAATFAAEPDSDPPSIVADVTGQPVERLDTGWEDFITVWFAGGWRNNAFASLSLMPAEDLFARGAYESAADRANRTLELTTALDDRVASAEAELLIAQASVGMQAEALMKDAEEALIDHDYARAQTLIRRAEAQYALLPEDHRPSALIASWSSISTAGLGAIDDLAKASAAYDDWFSMRSTRKDAVSAGVTFAELGDTERHAVAKHLVDDLDARLTRLMLALGGAILILVGWLLVWSWNRAPARVKWPGLVDTLLQGASR